MNNRGFTLIELLAVITILAMLMAIVAPSVTNLVKRNKQDACLSLKTSIISATDSYVSDYKYDSSVVTGNNFNVYVSVLIDKKYLSNTIKNPLINNDTTDYSNDYVEVSYDSVSKLFNFEYVGNLDCSIS